MKSKYGIDLNLKTKSTSYDGGLVHEKLRKTVNLRGGLLCAPGKGDPLINFLINFN